MGRLFATVKKWFFILVFIVGVGYLLFRGLQYRLQQDILPLGSTVADLAVAGMTREEAGRYIEENYFAPIYLYHVRDHIELNPQDVGFTLDLESMFTELDEELSDSNEWLRFASFVLQRPIRTIEVPLRAQHDHEGLVSMMNRVTDFLDQPASAPQILGVDDDFQDGKPGYITDIDSSIEAIETALYQLENRTVELVVITEPAPERNMELLADAIRGELQAFNGLGSIFVMDLASGEELTLNSDVAVSGLSILKIGIFVEAFRAIDGPLNEYQEQLFLDSATRSSNFGANLLLHEVAGEDNTYMGADILTESMQNLGLINTFMAVPYDANPPAYRQTTYITTANSRTDVTTEPDQTMQSTAEEIGTLLSMIYYCAQGGGPLLAVYPEEITPDECQYIMDLMVLNEEGNLIRFGVPEGTIVSHKHGWARATHADAGIVFSPGGDFVIVEFLNQPGDWLLANESFPILREIARATYNYFNMDDPYLSDVLAERGLIDPEDPFSEFQEEGEAPSENGETDSIAPDEGDQSGNIEVPLDGGS